MTSMNMNLKERFRYELNESQLIDESFSSLLDKAKKGLITAAMLSSIMSSQAFSDEQKNSIKQAASSDVGSVEASSANIISNESLSALMTIRDCLNLNKPIDKLSDQDFNNVMINIDKMGDKIITDIESMLSTKEIYNLQMELKHLRGAKIYYKRDLPNVNKPTGKMDKQTLIAVVNLLTELKKRGITTSANYSTNKKSIPKGSFPTI